MDNHTTIDKFDRVIGGLEGVPGVDKTKPATITTMSPIIGAAQTFIVQTYRQRFEKDTKGKTQTWTEDTILVQYVDDTQHYRIVLPAEVADTIARQRDALSTKSRKRGAKAGAATRRAKGIQPAFLTKHR